MNARRAAKMTPDIFDRRTRGAGIVAVAALVWAVVTPDSVWWTAVLAGCLIGVVASTVVLVRSRQLPTLAQVIPNAAEEPAVGPGREDQVGMLRWRERRKP